MNTLLDIVQDILSETNLDNVNSIFDTESSERVANIVRSTYMEMMSNRNWNHLRRLSRLESISDTSKPNYLKLPLKAKEMVWLNYECENISGVVSPKEIKYKNPEDFLSYISHRKSDGTNTVIVEDFSGVRLFILNNADPTYWTSFDDEYIVFDSFNNAVDTTLQASKSQTLMYFIPEWSHTDSFVLDIPFEGLAALREEAKSTAFIALKQTVNSKVDQKAARQQRWLARKDWRAHGGVEYPDYGRKGKR